MARSAFKFEAVPLNIAADVEQLNYIRKVFGFLIIGLLVAAAGAQVGMSPALLPIIAGSPFIGFIAMFGMVIWASKASTGKNASAVYYAFSFVMGLIIAPLIFVTLNSFGGTAVLTQAAVLTGIDFLALLAYTWYSKKDFSFLGGFLMTGLITMIVAIVINALFLHSSAMGLFIPVIIVVLFNGFLLYDLSRILHSPNRMPATQAALNLFLDVFNIFLALLSILDRD
jgi:modulator of FtsH protease